MDARQERLAKNEAIFREVNENIDTAAERFQLDAAAGHDYVCECSDASCAVHVRLTKSEYETVRAHARRFAVAPGHEELEIETVVCEHARYLVVEKSGEAGILVEQLDTRGA